MKNGKFFEKILLGAEPLSKTFNLSHDRFLIIDNKDIYHLGASLKDLGKKWFTFSKIDIEGLTLLDKVKEF